MEKVLEDWRTAPVSQGKRAAFGFLEKYVLPEEDFSAADIDQMRQAGLSDEAIKDVMYVGFAFMVMSKSADAFGWRVHSDDELNDKVFANFLKLPYKMLALPG